MSYHWECGVAQWAYGELAQQFKGRILSEEDVKAMQQVFEVAKKGNREVKVYDTARVSDRLRALKRGVLRTPAVVMDGRRCEGLDEICRVVSRVLSL